MIRVTKEEFYRSDPDRLDMTDNMARLTITCTRNEWRELKRVTSNLEWPRLDVPKK